MEMAHELLFQFPKILFNAKIKSVFIYMPGTKITEAYIP